MSMPICSLLFGVSHGTLAQESDTNLFSSVVLTWEPSPAEDLSGYNIYYGDASTSYTNVLFVGNVTETEIAGLVRGATYYFCATALVGDGTESDFSNEVEYSVPPPPPELHASMLPPADIYSPVGSVMLEWTPLPDYEAAAYAIYYGNSSGSYNEKLVVPGQETHIVIEGLTNGLTYFFAAAPVSPEDIEGEIFNETSVALPEPPPEPEVNFALEIVELEPVSEFVVSKLVITKRPPASLGYVVRVGRPGLEPDSTVTYGDTFGIVQWDDLRQGNAYEISVAWIAEDGSEQELRRVTTLVVPRVWPKLQLSSNDEGRVVLKGTAPPGKGFDIYVSSNLEFWDAIATCETSAEGAFEYEDPENPVEKSRFYLAMPR